VDGQSDPGELLWQVGGVRFAQRLQLSLRLRLSELSAPAARSALSTFMTRSMGSTGF